MADKLKLRRLLSPGWAWLPVGLIFSGLITGIYLSAPEPRSRVETAPVPEYSTIIAGREDVQITLHSQGMARARHRIALSLQASGEIAELNPAFANGRWVEAGQVLAQLDPEPFELDIAQYKHEVSAARLHLSEVEANAVVARRNASRKATDFALFKPQIAEARSRLAAARSGLQMAERRLRETSLVAPFSGRLAEIEASPGQHVSAGEALGVLFSTPEVRLPLRDDWLQLLGVDFTFPHTELSVPVVLRGQFAGRERIWEATITRREGGINRNQMNWLIAEVNTEADELPLEPGVYVEAEIQGTLLEDVFVLPRDALIGQSEVWVLADGERLRRKAVDWVYRDGTHIYVSAGLEAGDLVLEQGNRHLLEGTPGRSVPREAEAPARDLVSAATAAAAPAMATTAATYGAAQ